MIEKLAPTLFGNTIIIGKITVEVNISGNISKLKFCVDDIVKNIDYTFHMNGFGMKQFSKA